MALSSKQQIARNTILLYGRTLLLMFISLFTSRVILKSLGVEDYGIYTAVAGVVTMLTMITGPMGGAISRYVTFELGRENQERLSLVFANSMAIMLFFVIIAVVILEALGIWFLNHKMVIPDERISAANWVFQISVLSFVINLLTIPYNAVIIAHERMTAFAFIGILDGVLKLIIAYAIFVVSDDKLITYAFLMGAISFINLGIYFFYCRLKFIECYSFRVSFNKQISSGMFGFAGWNLLGGAASVCHVQGTNILLNLFGGPIVNTAQGLANQVNSAVTSFVGSFTTAMTPSIIKSYALENRNYMLSLVYQGARFSYYLVLFLCVPLFLETEFIVNVWLDQCPDHTVNLIRLVLMGTLIDSISKTLISALNATGIIRDYQLIVGGILLLNLPISYIALKLGAPVEATALVYVALSLLSLTARMVLARTLVGLSIGTFARNVLLRVFIVTIVAFTIPLLIHLILPYSIQRLLSVLFIGMISTSLAILFIGCSKGERQILYSRFLFSIMNKN